MKLEGLETDSSTEDNLIRGGRRRSTFEPKKKVLSCRMAHPSGAPSPHRLQSPEYPVLLRATCACTLHDPRYRRASCASLPGAETTRGRECAGPLPVGRPFGLEGQFSQRMRKLWPGSEPAADVIVMGVEDDAGPGTATTTSGVAVDDDDDNSSP
jgi:hypothetical protein